MDTRAQAKEILARGPITRRDLAFALGKSERQVRRIVGSLIEEGVPVVHGADGYRVSYVFYYNTARRLRRQAQALLRRADALEDACS